MGKRIDVAERLKDLGFDPVDTMVRIITRAEATGNLALAAKISADLLEYTAPKLKSMELGIEPETRDFLLKREERLTRIRALARQLNLVTLLASADMVEGAEATVIEGEATPVPAALLDGPKQG